MFEISSSFLYADRFNLFYDGYSFFFVVFFFFSLALLLAYKFLSKFVANIHIKFSFFPSFSFQPQCLMSISWIVNTQNTSTNCEMNRLHFEQMIVELSCWTYLNTHAHTPIFHVYNITSVWWLFLLMPVVVRFSVSFVLSIEENGFSINSSWKEKHSFVLLVRIHDRVGIDFNSTLEMQIHTHAHAHALRVCTTWFVRSKNTHTW